MVLTNKSISAELMLHFLINKNENTELYKFIDEYVDGNDFEFLHNIDKRGTSEKDIDKFFDQLKKEISKRANQLSDAELQDFIKDLKEEKKYNLSDEFIKYVWTIKNKSYNDYDLENTIKPTLLEATKYVKTYFNVLMNTEDMEHFCENVYNNVAKINNINYKKKSTELNMSDITNINKLFDISQQQYISTGYNHLDKILVGGLPKEDTFLFLIMAPSGLGKSLLMLNLANNIIKNNLKVLLVSLEMSVSTYTKRFITLSTSVPFNQLQDKKDKVLKQYSLISKTIGKNLRIVEYPTSQATVVDLENKILQCRAEQWSPDVVIVDYLTIMKPLNKVQSNKGYESGITLAEELRGLSGKLKIPFISAIQSNRNENYNSEKVDISNVSESYGIVSTCDFLGALYQLPGDKENGKINFKTLKNRNGDSFSTSFFVDYQSLKISEPIIR